jgi:glycosyltransferase involved in cell wall biosynthesis
MAEPANVDFVLLPHLEAIGLLQLGLHPNAFAGKPWATISVGVRFHHRAAGISGPTHWQDAIQRWFFHRVIAQPNLACFGAVNPYLAQTERHPKVVWCPEPAPAAQLSPSEIARKAYGLRAETIVVLVFGFISRRKCVDVLLAAVDQLPADQDVTVFLAGTQHGGHMRPILDSDVAQRLRARGRLVEEDRFIMVGPDIDPMSVADISWIFYERNFVYTGNVLVRSAHAGRAVICRNQGVIGQLVRDCGCGIALDSEDPDIVAGAVTRLAADPALRDRMGANGKQAFARNTPDAFAQPIVDSIRIALSGS